MKASLIFCSTSHSINVQKVLSALTYRRSDFAADLQNCLVKSIRLEVYHPRNFGRRRTHIRVHGRMINSFVAKTERWGSRGELASFSEIIYGIRCRSFLLREFNFVWVNALGRISTSFLSAL
jgi:hypothetical protein